MPIPPPTADSGKTEDGRDASGRRLHTGPTQIYKTIAEVRYTPGRGCTIDWAGERYLPEAVTKELGWFYARAIPMLVAFALALGWLAGHYWL